MKEEIQIETIYGVVIGKANNYMAVPDTAAGGSRIVKNEKIRRYEHSFLSQCKVYRDRHINTPFAFHVRVFFRSQSNDLDNAVKTLLDCLQMAGAVEDDNLCNKLVAEKFVDRFQPRAEFCIIPEEPQPRLF